MAADKSSERKFTGIRIPRDLLAAIQRIAAREDRTVNAQILRCLRHCVELDDARQRALPQDT